VVFRDQDVVRAGGEDSDEDHGSVAEMVNGRPTISGLASRRNWIGMPGMCEPASTW